MENGIYFNMPAAEYHKVKAMSASFIKNILISPTHFWFNSPFNPEYKDEQTQAMKDGTLYHKLILEPESFDDEYVVMPQELAELNQNTKEVKQWKAEQTKKILKPQDYDRVNNNLKLCESWILPQIFSNGYPEVSVFWERDGVPCKCRIDYLTLACNWDLKTYTKRNFEPERDYILKLFYQNRTYQQVVFYNQAVEQFKKLPVYGTWKQKRFIKKIEPQEQAGIFYVNREAPCTQALRFSKIDCPGLWRLAEAQINKAFRIFKDCQEYYGEDPWVANEGLYNLSDNNFPQMFYDKLAAEDE